MRRLALSTIAILVGGVALLAALVVPAARGGEPGTLRTSTAAALDAAPLPERGLRSLFGLGGPSGGEGHAALPLGSALDALDVGGALATTTHTSLGEFAAAATVLETGKLGTYIDEVLASSDSLVTRWPVRDDDGLRYWIQPGADLPGWTVTHRRMITEAFAAWNDAALPVHFSETADSSDADVVVVWRDQFDEPISGKTRWTHDRHGWIRTARVTIALHRYTGEPLDTDAVRAIGLHEVGHALGLDHTSDYANVMAPRVRVRQLSDADRATAQLLYRLPPGSLKR